MSRQRFDSPSQRMQCVRRAVPRRICVTFRRRHVQQAVLVGDLEADKLELAVPAVLLGAEYGMRRAIFQPDRRDRTGMP